MKKSLLGIALIILGGLTIALSLGACNSLPTLQQQFAQGCTVVNGDLQILAASPLVSPASKELINGVPGDPTKPGILAVNTTICKAGGQLSVANLQMFHDSLLPIAETIVQGAPALPDQQLILLALQTFGPIVQAQIDQLIHAVAPAASAPVAASQ